MADSKRPDDDAGQRHSVLAELPNTRPQRPSRRREATRTRTSTAPGKPGTTKPSKPKTAAKAKPAAEKQTKARRRGPATATSTPRQGYEADSELMGTPVSPPTGTEIVGALAELAGELANTGISAGGRLLKGALSRLSG